MAEYIEREAVHDLVQSLTKYAWASPVRNEQRVTVDADDVQFGVDKIPSADVAPVRHARWIEPPRLYYGAKQYECSLCYSDTFWNKHCITEKYKHCPNCGCKMDLEG